MENPSGAGGSSSDPPPLGALASWRFPNCFLGVKAWGMIHPHVWSSNQQSLSQVSPWRLGGSSFLTLNSIDRLNNAVETLRWPACSKR